MGHKKVELELQLTIITLIGLKGACIDPKQPEK